MSPGSTMETTSRDSRWANPRFAATILSYASDHETGFPCPITGSPRQGDLSHLCEVYDCARKGGLSPRSEEHL
jgi:hypothetical protein